MTADRSPSTAIRNPQPRPLDLRQPGPGITRFTIPLAMSSPDHLHVHLLEMPNGWLLVDCGARGSEGALDAGLNAAGGSVDRVLITHAHVDHWGLATTLTEEVMAHPGVESSLRFASEGPPRDARPGWPDSDQMSRAFAGFERMISGVPEVAPIADGDLIGEWQVLWTPGHDPGHVCLYRQSDGVLLCGDLLLPGFTPNIQPDPSGRDALGDFLASLDRVAALPIELVLPAHGAPYTDAAARARELRRHHAERLDRLREALLSGIRTLVDLCAAAFSADYASEADRMLALMETYAHLEHLRLRGAALVDDKGAWSLSPL
jgi:glyoxylase-like metal-dependent hydrolase (beta-lactamase superfamily II)